MDTNQKTALRQTLADVVQPLSAAVAGSVLGYAVIYTMDRLGFSTKQIVGGGILLLIAGVLAYLVYDLYRYNLMALRRESDYRARTAQSESEGAQ